MKKLVFSMALIGVIFCAEAQTNPVKIVFDVTSADPTTHESVMRHVKSMASSYPESRFEVVLYSKSFEMALKDKSVVSDEINSLADNKNVEFKICEMTLQHRGIKKNELLPGFETVPDGIMEIVQKQQEGWSYIKESHN